MQADLSCEEPTWLRILRSNLAIPKTVHNDFNGGGRSEVLLRDDNGNVFTFDGGNFKFITIAAADWQIVGTGDFNGDRRADILWRSDAGVVTEWLGQSDGSFLNNWANFTVTATSDWHIISTGDFNGDGRDDILWRAEDGTITDWLGQSNGSFVSNGAAFTIKAASNWHVAATGDFNGDGRTDMLWRADDGAVTDWLGEPDGSFTNNWANFHIQATSNWHIATSADMNGDGFSDIVWRADDGTITDWLGEPDGGFISNGANFTVQPTDGAFVNHLGPNPTAATSQIVGFGDFWGFGRDAVLMHDDLGIFWGIVRDDAVPLTDGIYPFWSSGHVQPEQAYL